MSIVFQIQTDDLVDVAQIVQKMKPYLLNGTVFLLDGDLGSGKTTFVSCLMNDYGFKDSSSPTYSLINTYNTSSGQKITHVDLYRLTDDEDIDSSGFWDIFSDHNRIIFIEWASKVDSSLWPLDWKIFQIEIKKQQEKRLYIFSKLQS